MLLLQCYCAAIGAIFTFVALGIVRELIRNHPLDMKKESYDTEAS